MQTIDQLIATSLKTADATDRIAAADAAFAATFAALPADAQARCWRGLDHGAKFRLVVRRIEALGLAWLPSVVEEFIAKYDERFALGPVEAAIEGALERLAIDHAQHAVTALAKDDRTFFRRATTSYVRALQQYRNGVRPELLQSGAWLLPSSRAGEPPHIVRMDGDWVCSCTAQRSMHWSIALLIGIEVAGDDMERFDDGDDALAALADPLIAALDAIEGDSDYEADCDEVRTPWRIGAVMARAMAQSASCDPPGENPLGDTEGDELPARWPSRLAAIRAASSWYALAA